MNFTGDVELVGDWRRLRRILNPVRFQRDLHRHATRATFLNARDFQQTVRAYVRAHVYAGNAPLTVTIKGRDYPLVDHGDLMRNIRVSRVTPTTYFVGVLNTERWRSHSQDGNSYSNARRDGRMPVDIAEILHEGFVIRFTPAVVRAIMAKLDARGGSRGKAGTSGVSGSSGLVGSVRIVPARPFIRTPFNDPAFRTRALARWRLALAAALGSATGLGAAAPFASLDFRET